MELPPSSKKLSWRPACVRPSTSHQTWATFCSVGEAGGTKAVAEPGMPLGAGKALRSSFPFGVRGKAGKVTKVEGSMNSGSLGLRNSRKLAAAGANPGRGHDVSNEPFVPRHVFPDGDRAIFDLRMSAKAGFDFTQLDAEAAQLDLLVDAAEEFDVAIGQIAGQVAGAVEAGAGAGVKRMGDEFFSGQLRAVEIAASEAGTANQQFARDANRDRLEVFIHDVDLGVGDRAADGDGLLSFYRRPGWRTKWWSQSARTC